MDRKGVNMSVNVVIILVIGALLILAVMGAWNTFEGGTDNTFSDSEDESESQVDESVCKTNCRSSHPNGGGDYQSCVQSCS